jgi:hypothetical protein
MVRCFYTSIIASFYVDHWMKQKLLLALGLVTSTLVHAGIAKTGGTHPTVTIEKTCEGYSFESAKQSCFDSAIEQVVGQLIVSDLEVSGDVITKDTVARYSAGYIDDYVIKKQQRDDHGWWRLEMSVTIASSKIADRKISRSERVDLVDGLKAKDLIENQLDQRADGDMLISTVISSYPENAYVINSGKTEFSVGRLRQAYVDVPYSITMSQPWLTAFVEALDAVAVDSNNCSNFKSRFTRALAQTQTGVGDGVKRLADRACASEPDLRVTARRGWFADTKSYYFADVNTLEMINSNLQTQGQQHIGLRVDMLDAGGNIIDTRCARINNELFIQYARPRGTYDLRDQHTDSRPSIQGHSNVYGTLRVTIKNTQQLEDLSKIKLNIQQTCV